MSQSKRVMSISVPRSRSQSLSFLKHARQHRRSTTRNSFIFQSVDDMMDLDKRELVKLLSYKRFTYHRHSGASSVLSSHVTAVHSYDVPERLYLNGRRGKKATFCFLPPVEHVKESEKGSLDSVFSESNLPDIDENLTGNPKHDLFKRIQAMWSDTETSSEHTRDGERSIHTADTGNRYPLRPSHRPQAKVEFINVELTGQLKPVGSPESVEYRDARDMELDPMSSVLADVDDRGFLADLNIWPWPWINPEKRAQKLYRDFHSSTFAGQTLLPTTPLPLLARTLKRYLEAVKPCVKTYQYDQTKKIVETFAMTEGDAYHQILISRGQCKHNWMKKVLPNYLNTNTITECPLINHAIIAPYIFDFWPRKDGSQIEVATALIEFSIEFFHLVYDEKLKVLTDPKGHKLCMHNIRRLFAATRLPGLCSDSIVSNFKTFRELEANPTHIIVLCRGKIFKMDVMDEAQHPIRKADIKSSLCAIVAYAEKTTADFNPGIGILTSGDRDEWASSRQMLMDLGRINIQSLFDIESSLFALSLDHMSSSDLNSLGLEAIFADGYNRWYDKSLNFYVHRDGVVTVNSNSSLTDAWSVEQLLNYIHYRVMEIADRWDPLETLPPLNNIAPGDVSIGNLHEVLGMRKHVSMQLDNIIHGTTKATVLDQSGESKDWYEHTPCKTRMLKFVLDDNLNERIEFATMWHTLLSDSMKSAVSVYDNIPVGIFVKKNIDKEAFIHMVIHLTFFRMYHRIASAGSTVCTRRFYHSTQDTMWTATMEVKEWCQIMMDPNSSHKMKERAFRKAEAKHELLLEECKAGKGIGHHLIALEVISEDPNAPRDQSGFFDDPSYSLCGGEQRFDVYSGSLGIGSPSTPVILPMQEAGYGIGYSIVETRVIFSVTTWKTEPNTCAQLMACSLKITLSQIEPFLDQVDYVKKQTNR